MSWSCAGIPNTVFKFPLTTPIDLHENLIEMPLPLSMLAHVGSTLRSDLTSEDRAEPIHPSPYAFVADVDPAFVEQVFDIAQRKGKTNIHHDRELDDLG